MDGHEWAELIDQVQRTAQAGRTSDRLRKAAEDDADAIADAEREAGRDIEVAAMMVTIEAQMATPPASQARDEAA